MSSIAGVCFRIKFNDSTFMQGTKNGKFCNTEGLSKTMLYITRFPPIWHLRHSVTNRLHKKNFFFFFFFFFFFSSKVGLALKGSSSVGPWVLVILWEEC